MFDYYTDSHKKSTMVDGLDCVSQSDRLFFELHPERKYRIRYADQAEIEFLKATGDPTPTGWWVYAAVCNVAPGVRTKVFLAAPEVRETNVSDDMARAVFEAYKPTGRTRERSL